MQHAYEDRIAKLRYELDRATSKQLLNQQVVQDKVAELLERQETLSSRHGQLSPILSRAGLIDALKENVPVPAPMREDNAYNEPSETFNRLNQAQLGKPSLHSKTDSVELARRDQFSASDINTTNQVFGSVALSLANIEQEQIHRIQLLAQDTCLLYTSPSPRDA